jgi:phospholipid-translocating ATPase
MPQLLTRKVTPEIVNWTPECSKALEILMNILTSEPLLTSPNFSKPFILQTDASEIGIGAVLSQADEEGLDYPVAYFSRKLLPREQKFATIEKECLAIKLGIQAFHVYVFGKPFEILTDNRALQWLDQVKDSNNRLLRWSLMLQPYMYTIRHRKGIENANADSLSRIDWPAQTFEGGRSVTDPNLILWNTMYL